MRVDSFVFYASFYNSISLLEDDVRLELYDAICIYALDHEQPTFTSVVSQSIFELIKPQIDANYQRRQNGKMGGRPMSQSDEESEDKDTKKPSVSKKKTNGSAKRKPNVNVNANVNGNVNVNANEDTKAEVVDCSPEFSQALKDFEAMRKSIKKPLTPRAKEMILKELSKLAPDEKTQIEILNQSVLHSWQGVYPLKKKELSIEDMLNMEIPEYSTDDNPSFDQGRFDELMKRRSA